jgi:hypothetical protein
MGQIGWRDPATGKEAPFEEWLNEANAYGAALDFPYEILQGLHKDMTQKNRPDGISVTQILGCARAVTLEKQHEYYAEPTSNFIMWRGTLAHSMLEANKPEDAVVERRLWRVYKGVTISGQIDSVRVTGIDNAKEFLAGWLDWCDLAYAAENENQPIPEAPEIPAGARFLIRDWKTKNELPSYNYAAPSHQKQGNLYRWLLRIDPKIADIEFVYIAMEGVKLIPLTDGGTHANGRAKPRQIWTDEEADAFLDDRLLTLAATKNAKKPLPYAMVPTDDLWQCGYCRAKDLCHSLAAKEAEAEWKKGNSVEKIPPRDRAKEKGKRK